MSHTIPLGQLATPDACRDAIHLAIAPVIAAERLKPGESVTILQTASLKMALITVEACAPGEGVGIVDPFLKRGVKANERFYVLLYPNTITSLRHEWTHSAFETAPAVVAAQPLHANEEYSFSSDMDRATARANIQALADDVDLTYDALIEAAKAFLDTGEYLCEGSQYMNAELPDSFWPDFELVTGRKVPGDKRWSFFSCSC